MAAQIIDVTAGCNCGRIEFEARGPTMFKAYCHCRPCSRARGMSPVQLIAVPAECLKVTKGEVKITMDEAVRRGDGRGMVFAHCADCGTHLWMVPAAGRYCFGPCKHTALFMSVRPLRLSVY